MPIRNLSDLKDARQESKRLQSQIDKLQRKKDELDVSINQASIRLNEYNW